MELICDWKNFQQLFFTRKRPVTVGSDPAGGSSQSLQQGLPAQATHPIFVILRGKVIVAAYSENEDLGLWVGATVDELSAVMPGREIVNFEKEKVDQWITQACDLDHFYEQKLFFRTMAQPMVAKAKKFKSDDTWVHGHFLLEAIQTWWCKLFPAQYGIYIQLDGGEGPTGPSMSSGQSGASILILVKRGKIDSFHVPDLSSIPADRRKQNPAIVKYLSGRYVVPVQGFFLSSEEWNSWHELKNPWSKILSAIQADRSKVAPLNWGLITLIASRAYLRI